MPRNGARLRTRRTTPCPVGLAIAQEMQERLKPALIILQGSRAAGDHRQDFDCDLMAVCPDHASRKEMEKKLRELLDGEYGLTATNALTITDEEFRRTAPLAQSPAGQAVRHGVTPEGLILDYYPDREPE